MPDFFEKIQRVLELEKEKEYSNSAVSGGLANFSAFIKRQEITPQITGEVIHSLLSFFQSYPSLSFASRKSSIQTVLDWIANGPSTSPPGIPILDKIGADPISQNKFAAIPHQDPAIYAGLMSINGIGERKCQVFS